MNRKKRLFSNRILLELILWFRVLLVKILIRRSQPDFMIIGAQKCGTTSLFNYICQYSTNFKPPLVKETQFFTQNYAKGLDYYYAHFPLFKSPTQITGEASPTYLFFKKAAKRTHLHFPQLKLVVLLRDPVDRAYSHYHFSMRNLPESQKISFEEALEREDKLNFQTYSDYLSTAEKKSSYKSRGLYADQIEYWLEFFNMENIYFIEADELKKSPDKILTNLFLFLGLKKENSADFNNLKKYNRNSYPNMATKTQGALRKFFQAPNQKLFALLNKTYPWK
ncbi:MAG: hypothetical protein COW84_07425 [Gammaproteobacteria bacterium CG22_combo_CG10-13_8_21_14_all_40_8]|nr:MAG: hypothetical protein COW84_07425 [Gammaproteobacteria bacterium CG22_combo_CG10-13_8_21_14_all_40_8]